MTNLQICLVLLCTPFFVDALRDTFDLKEIIGFDASDEEAEKKGERICNAVVSTRVDFQLDLMDDDKMKKYVDAYASGILNRDPGTSISFDGEIEKRTRERIQLEAELMRNYSTSKICTYKNMWCNTTVDGINIYDIEKIMETSTDYDTLLHTWSSWMNVAGRGRKKSWTKLSELKAKHSVVDGPGIHSAEPLWMKIEPLYVELHKYVAKKLKERYKNIPNSRYKAKGAEIITSDGLIPIHILGNMWGENWLPLYDLVKPFRDTLVNMVAPEKMEAWKVEDMYMNADDYFVAFDLKESTSAFQGPGHMIEKPDGKEVDCYPTAHDFCNGTYRITFCTRPRISDLMQVFHQMGHVQYFQQYQHLPLSQRNSPHPAIHDAIGESVALGALSPGQLKHMGLMQYERYQNNNKIQINYLMMMALAKIPVLPVALALGKWKEDVGSMKEDEWNSHWWKLLGKYQRVKHPVGIGRSKDDLDAIARYDMTGKPYDFENHFFARLLEFQSYQKACKVYKLCEVDCSSETCDWHISDTVGKVLEGAMKVGSTKSYFEVVAYLTNYSTAIRADALLEYFKPLHEFLKKDNKLEERKKKEVNFSFWDIILIGIPMTYWVIFGGGCVFSVICLACLFTHNAPQPVQPAIPPIDPNVTDADVPEMPQFELYELPPGPSHGDPKSPVPSEKKPSGSSSTPTAKSHSGDITINITPPTPERSLTVTPSPTDLPADPKLLGVRQRRTQ